MENSEIHYELLQEIQDRVNVDLDKEITLFLIKNRSKNIKIEDFIRELNLPSFEEELFVKYSTLKCLGKQHNLQNQEREVSWQNITEYDKYEEFLQNLSKSPYLTSELLDELLKVQYIDSKQSYWHDITTKLQECFVCLNYELFLKSLKIHFKIISIQNLSVDGFLSLLKATNKIVRSNFIKELEYENLSHSRILLCIKIILTTELLMLDRIHASPEKIIEELIDHLISLFSYKMNIKEKNKVILELVSSFDREAEWFKYLCMSGYLTPLVYKKLEKYPAFLVLVFDNFLELLKCRNSFDYMTITNFYSHSCYFLVYFFRHCEYIKDPMYKNNLVKELSFPKLISLIVNAINNNQSSSEIREMLIFFITRTFEGNPNLINQGMLEILFKPFENIINDNSLRIINNNSYVFKIVQLVAKVNDKVLTNGYLYNRRKYRSILQFAHSANELSRERNNSNVPQLIIDITILMLRNYINKSEKSQLVDDLVMILLECCENIYQSHPVFFYNLITSKFIVNLKSFYKALCNFDSSVEEIKKVLTIFKLFFQYCPNITKLLNDGMFSVIILDNILTKNIEVSNHLIFYNFSNEKFSDELQIQLNMVTQSFLISSWQINSLDGNTSDGNFCKNEAMFELLCFVNGISHNLKLIKMLTSNCRECDSQRKNTISIPTMLKVCVQNVRDTTETYTSLLLLKVMISNLDGLVHLQAILNLKDNISKVQRQIDVSSESESDDLNLDKCSMVRKNILSTLEFIGYPNRELNILHRVIDTEFEQDGTSATRVLCKKISRPCDLQKFLQKSRAGLHDHSWISQVKKLFQKFSSEGNKVSLVAEIVDQFPKTMVKNISRSWLEAVTWLPHLYQEEAVAISFIVKFGLKNQLLNVGYKHEENLAFLLKRSRVFLDDSSQEFDGFDWFIGVCFLICSGNLEKCKLFCANMSNLPSANLIWHKFGKLHGSSWLENFLQHLDVILAENTTIYTALKMANLSPTIIVKKWLSQCFFNILDFKEICNFIVFSVIHPLECSVYYMLCLFIHNKDNICSLTHTYTLENLLNVISLDDFKLTSYTPMINKYTKRYRNIIKL